MSKNQSAGNEHNVKSTVFFSCYTTTHLPKLNRFRTRPVGVAEKNDCGTAKILSSKVVNSWREEIH